MEEKVIDLTNAQVGDKFMRADGEVVTVVCRFRSIHNICDEWLCIVDKENKGGTYRANEYSAEDLKCLELEDQVDIPQMPAPGVPNPQAEGAGVPSPESKLADTKKAARIARRERIAFEFIKTYGGERDAHDLGFMIDQVEKAILTLDEGESSDC